MKKLKVRLKLKYKLEQKESQHKTTFEFCDKNKNFQEDLVCQQDSVH